MDNFTVIVRCHISDDSKENDLKDHLRLGSHLDDDNARSKSVEGRWSVATACHSTMTKLRSFLVSPKLEHVAP